MSTYENYSDISKHYDKTRVPVGGEILIGALAQCGQTLATVRLLDAGCGTGAYSALVATHVGHIDALDINPDMLAVARDKLEANAKEGNADFHLGNIDALPFPAGRFDAVMFNQVLHHLETGENDRYDGHRRALGEAHRVLRPGGLAVINCTTHEQTGGGFWYMHLLPTAAKKIDRRCIPANRLEALLQEIGFDLDGRFVPLDGVLQGQAYFDAAGPMKPEWRKGDSIWSLASDKELAEAERILAKAHAEGTLDTYLAEHDAKRRLLGQTTYFVARKARTSIESSQ